MKRTFAGGVASIPAGTYVEPPSAAEKVIYVSANGDDSRTGQHPGQGAKGAVKTLARALTLMGTSARGVIQMGWGTIETGVGSLKLAGYRCLPVGRGPATTVVPTGPQNGPVIDGTGWIQPGFEYVQEFGNFCVEGDNTAAPTIANVTFKQLTGSTVTLTTDVAHGLAVGDTVWVRDVPVAVLGGGGRAKFTGVYTITAVPTTTTFSYTYYVSPPGDVASTAATGTVRIAKHGVVLPNSTGVLWRPISVRKTGGPGIDISGSQEMHMHAPTIEAPVAATANDVPYFYGEGASNGNRIYGLMLRASAAGADAGVSGAVVLVDDGIYPADMNTFYGPAVEALTLPDDGCMFKFRGNHNTIDDMHPWDSDVVTAGDATAWVRFDAPTISNLGGNQVSGLIPGSQGGNDIDCGIEFNQSNNCCWGVKGYNGANVGFGTGVAKTVVLLLSATNGTTTTPIHHNDSVATTNLVIDASGGEFKFLLGSLRGLTSILSTQLTLTNSGTTALHIGAEGGFAKLRFDGSGSMFWGSGSGAADVTLSRPGAGRLQFGGSLEFVDSTAALSRPGSGRLNVNADLELGTAGKGLRVKEGSNAKQGTATLVAGTVTVSNTSVTANSRILLTVQSLGTVTSPKAVAVTARSAGTSFTITSADVTDTSVVAWEIFEPA